MRLELIQSFIKVAEFGSFTKAAEIGRIPKSRLSRQVQELEAELGVMLIQRTNRSIALTQEGQLFFEDCRISVQKLEEAQLRIKEHSSAPKGKLRITTPPELGQYLAIDLVPRFVKKYPQVQLEIESSLEVKDLAKEGFDLAIRPGRIENESLIVRKMGEAEFILASSENFHARIKNIKTPQSLEQLPFILRRPHAGGHELQFSKQNQRFVMRPQNIIFETTNFFSARHAMLQDLGMSYIPRFLIDRDLKNGDLVNLFPDWSSKSAPINIVLPSRKYIPPKVRVFIDLMSKLIQDQTLAF